MTLKDFVDLHDNANTASLRVRLHAEVKIGGISRKFHLGTFEIKDKKCNEENLDMEAMIVTGFEYNNQIDGFDVIVKDNPKTNIREIQTG